MGGRSRTHALLVGLFASILSAGLLLPFVAGGPVHDVRAGGPPEAELSLKDPAPAVAAPDGMHTDSDAVAATPTGGSAVGPTAGTADEVQGAATRATPPPSGSLTATDRGVTSEVVKVGFLMLDVGGLGRVGVSSAGVDPKQQRLLFQAYVDEINRSGGINGRRIQPFFRNFDPVNNDDMRAACLEMTQDHKVFAVVGNSGYQGPALLCVSHENETPVIVPGQAVPKSWFRQAQGRLVTLVPEGNRQLRNLVHEFHTAGMFRRGTLGVLTEDSPQGKESVDTGLLPALQEYGYEAAHVSRLAADQATAGSQIPVEIQRMRAAGVDTVLVVAGFLGTTQWVQAAEGQGWRPRYLVSELSGMTSDFETQAMPSSFDGAIALTSMRWGEWRRDAPEPAPDAHCRKLYEEASGQTLARNTGDDTNQTYGTMMFACGVTAVFHAAAKAAGPMLTRATFAAAVQRLGSVPVPWYLGGSFGPGKTDLTDTVRFIRWQADCSCYMPLDAPRRGRFTSA